MCISPFKVDFWLKNINIFKCILVFESDSLSLALTKNNSVIMYDDHKIKYIIIIFSHFSNCFL